MPALLVLGFSIATLPADGQINVIGGNGRVTLWRPAPPDHPELHFAFLQNHVRQVKEIDDRKAAGDQAKGNAIEAGAAAGLGLTIGEFAMVSAIVADFERDRQKVETDTRQHLDDSKRKGQQPDPAVMQSLGGQRYLAIVTTMDRIKKTLPEASWNKLRNVLNTEMHHSVQIAEISAGTRK